MSNTPTEITTSETTLTSISADQLGTVTGAGIGAQIGGMFGAKGAQIGGIADNIIGMFGGLGGGGGGGGAAPAGGGQ